MEKRAFERLSTNLQARLFYGNMVYTGIVTNLSENGMFICTMMHFPVDSVLVAALLVDGHALKLSIKIKRTVKSNMHHNCIDGSGLGVRLLNPPNDYLKFVINYK